MILDYEIDASAAGHSGGMGNELGGHRRVGGPAAVAQKLLVRGLLPRRAGE